MEKGNGVGKKRDSPSVLLAFDWFDERLYRGIVRFAAQESWHLSPYLFSDRNLPYNWSGDGVITCYGPSLGKFIDSLKMPKVDVSVSSAMGNVPRVISDNEAIGRLAAAHFLNRGFQNFAFFSWPAVEVNVMRRKSYEAALKEAGIEKEQIHQIKQPANKVIQDWPSHEKELLKQLRSLPRPLAVFTGQDNLGATLVDVCVRNGIHLPEEIAVLGADNIEFLCGSLRVPLSSIDTQLEELGYQAARQLQRRLDGEIDDDEPPVILPPGRVITRLSSDVLAVSHPIVSQALRIMREEFQQALSIEHVCERVGMSKRGLEKAFQKTLSRSPAAELRRIRIDRAKRLLTETDLKIEAIASECGYCNSSNLSLAFRRDADLSPRAYRQKFRGKTVE